MSAIINGLKSSKVIECPIDSTEKCTSKFIAMLVIVVAVVIY